MEKLQTNKKNESLRHLVQTEAEVNGAVVKFMGGAHTEKLFLDNEQEIRGRIKECDVIVSELEVQGELDSEMKKFYNHISDVAREKEKEVFYPDPEKTAGDAVKNMLPAMISLLSTAGFAGFVAKKMWDGKEKIQETKRYEKYYGPKVLEQEEIDEGRRSFLRNSAKTVAAAGAAYVTGKYTGMSLAEQTGINRYDDIENIEDDNFYSAIDWRDLNIAQNIIELSEDNKNILVVYGSSHFSGIKKYLDHPGLVERKSAIYDYTFKLLTEK